MNQWSRSRKRIILALVLFVLVVLIGIPLFFLFYQKPTCFDKKLNGDETGVDCGGSCQLLCQAESLPLVTKGDPRVITVASSTYEVVALIDNPNPSAEIYRARYTFKVFDAVSTIPLKVIEGETYVPKGETFAIFEGPFTLEAGLVPSRATLEWSAASLLWRKNVETLPEVVVKNKMLTGENVSPRLDALVENTSIGIVSNIDLIALIYDAEGNIFAASKTFIDELSVGEEEPVIFTWPRPFPSDAAKIDIIIRIFPDKSFIR